MTINRFKKLVKDFYRENKRIFPWRQTSNPYAILVSEIMLQQTQTERVIPKYEAWLMIFPTFHILAEAKLHDVLKAWQGLGYNRRALALKKLAHIVSEKYKNKLPEEYEELVELPGIGPYTAGAIMAFAYNKPVPIIETNIRTAFIHSFFRKDHGQIHDQEILELVEKTLDIKNPREWYWALMDYGAHLKKIHGNLNTKSKHYVKQTKFIGSNRQIRAAVVRILTKNKNNTLKRLEKNLVEEKIITTEKLLAKILESLEEEGFIKKAGKKYFISF